MKAVLAVLATCVMAGAAVAQQPVRNNDEEVKAAILRKVEERLAEQQKQILAEVKKMLDEHFAKSAAKPAPAKAPGFLGIQGKVVVDGIEVQQVIKDTPAMKAGLAKGDVLLSVNGKKSLKMEDLVKQLREIGAGEKATVEFQRGGETKKIAVTLGVRPKDDDDDDDDDDGDDDDDD
jgi:S1-C subfamily serine protease